MAFRGMDVDEVRAAAGGDPSGAGDRKGPGTDGMSPSIADPSDPAGDEKLSQHLISAYIAMEDDDKKALLREVAEQELAQYGLEDVEVVFTHIPPETGADGTEWYAAGVWDGEQLILNTHGLHNPEMMLTAVHEARHAAQWEFMEETEPGAWDWLPLYDSQAGDYARIEEEHGVTREEIESWRESRKHPVDYGEDPEGYLAQAHEVDARESEDEFALRTTHEDMAEYQREAGVPVTVSTGS